MVLAAVTASGCLFGSKSPKAPPQGAQDADKFLYEKGTALLEKRNWVTAREYFKRLVDGFPQSPYRMDGKLGVGDSYLGEGRADSLVLAANEFREYLQYFPTSEKADYAQYRLAASLAKSMLSPQRDQTATQETLTEVKRFIDSYPTSKYRPEVDKIERNARDHLSEAEYRVGQLYFRGKWYFGAVTRFSTVLRDDPGYSKRDEVYYFLAESLIKLGQGPQALPLYDKLLTEYPKSKYAKKAAARMAELKKAQGGGRP